MLVPKDCDRESSPNASAASRKWRKRQRLRPRSWDPKYPTTLPPPNDSFSNRTGKEHQGTCKTTRGAKPNWPTAPSPSSSPQPACCRSQTIHVHPPGFTHSAAWKSNCNSSTTSSKALAQVTSRNHSLYKPPIVQVKGLQRKTIKKVVGQSKS